MYFVMAGRRWEDEGENEGGAPGEGENFLLNAGVCRNLRLTRIT